MEFRWVCYGFQPRWIFVVEIPLIWSSEALKVATDSRRALSVIWKAASSIFARWSAELSFLRLSPNSKNIYTTDFKKTSQVPCIWFSIFGTADGKRTLTSFRLLLTVKKLSEGEDTNAYLRWSSGGKWSIALSYFPKNCGIALVTYLRVELNWVLLTDCTERTHPHISRYAPEGHSNASCKYDFRIDVWYQPHLSRFCRMAVHFSARSLRHLAMH